MDIDRKAVEPPTTTPLGPQSSTAAALGTQSRHRWCPIVHAETHPLLGFLVSSSAAVAMDIDRKAAQPPTIDVAMGRPPAIDIAVGADQAPAAAPHPFTVDVAMEFDRIPRQFKRKREDQDRFREDQLEGRSRKRQRQGGALVDQAPPMDIDRASVNLKRKHGGDEGGRIDDGGRSRKRLRNANPSPAPLGSPADSFPVALAPPTNALRTVEPVPVPPAPIPPINIIPPIETLRNVQPAPAPVVDDDKARKKAERLVRIAKRAEQARLLAIKEAAEEARSRADWERRGKARAEQAREEQARAEQAREEQAREERDRDEGRREQEEEKIPAVATRKKPAPWILARKNNAGTLRRSDAQTLRRNGVPITDKVSSQCR
jgi:hypothetical protein